MKRISIFNLLFFLLAYLYVACSNNAILSELPSSPKNDDENIAIYDWEKNRTTLLDHSDVVLIYSGGSHRNFIYDDNFFKPYVIYKDRAGIEHWMFDSFLFLEIYDGDGVQFAPGYTGIQAIQQDWKKLVDVWFGSSANLGALDDAIENAKKKLGEPEKKRTIILGIPFPERNQVNWGIVKEKELHFINLDDRVTACKWFIDYARQKFNAMEYKNIDLAGFYWIHEADYWGTSEIVPQTASYLNSLKYSLTWVPYYNAPGAFNWKEMKFNYAYYQPNYFFSEDKTYSQLTQACEDAIRNGMDIEIEFDDRVLVQFGDWGYRLEDYLNAFSKYGVSENNRIAYYQSWGTLYKLSNAVVDKEEQLYHKFCRFVSGRSK